MRRIVRTLMAPAVLGLLMWGAWWTWRTPRLGAEPLAWVPENTTALLWADIPALTDSMPWRALVDGDETGGVRPIEALCGFNPWRRLDEAAIFVFGDEIDRPGFVGRGRLDPDSLAPCIDRVVSEDGGALHALTLNGVPAMAGRGNSVAAFVSDDSVVGGDEAAVRAVLAVAQREASNATSNAELARLWDRVAIGADLVLVGAVPAHWRQALAAWAARRAEMPALPVQDVRAGALALRLERGLELDATVAMASPESAAMAAQAVSTWFGRGAERATLRGASAHAIGNEVRLSAAVDPEPLRRWIVMAREALAAGFAEP